MGAEPPQGSASRSSRKECRPSSLDDSEIPGGGHQLRQFLCPGVPATRNPPISAKSARRLWSTSMPVTRCRRITWMIDSLADRAAFSARCRLGTIAGPPATNSGDAGDRKSCCISMTSIATSVIFTGSSSAGHNYTPSIGGFGSPLHEHSVLAVSCATITRSFAPSRSHSTGVDPHCHGRNRGAVREPAEQGPRKGALALASLEDLLPTLGCWGQIVVSIVIQDTVAHAVRVVRNRCAWA